MKASPKNDADELEKNLVDDVFFNVTNFQMFSAVTDVALSSLKWSVLSTPTSGSAKSLGATSILSPKTIWKSATNLSAAR